MSSIHTQILFSMKLLYIYKHPSSSLFTSVSKPLLNNHKTIFKERKLIKNPSLSSRCIVHALKEDSKQYEIDPEKAKEALKELDQKIQSISNKQVSSPKLKGTYILSSFFLLLFFNLKSMPQHSNFFFCTFLQFQILNLRERK